MTNSIIHVISLSFISKCVYTVWSIQSHIFIGEWKMWWKQMWCSAVSHEQLESHMKRREKSKVLAGHTWIGVGFSAGDVSSTWTHWGSYLLSLQVCPPRAVPSKRRAPRGDQDPWSRFQCPCCCEKVIQKWHGDFSRTFMIACAANRHKKVAQISHEY